MKPWSQIEILFDRCKDSTDCASNDKIDEWFLDKMVIIEYIENSPLFSSLNQTLEKENIIIGGFPIASG